MPQSLASSSRAFVRCARVRPTIAQPLLQRMLLSTTAPTASPDQDSASASPTTASSSIPAGSIPFRIGRSNSLNFPVYHRIKSGGTNRTTEVKKVEGDARALSQWLAEELKLETKVNPRTKHVIVKVGKMAVNLQNTSSAGTAANFTGLPSGNSGQVADGEGAMIQATRDWK
jgi:hypothetical protein